MPLDVEVKWDLIDGDDDPLWRATRVLYAWHLPEDNDLLYLGKADFRSVRQRFDCASKEPVWSHIEEFYDTDEVDVRIGRFFTSARLTVELLEDVESLLIKRLKPCCNLRCTVSRIERPGLRVACSGDWPLRRTVFVDR